MEWLSDLADRQAKARILTRVQLMSTGNFGDSKPIQDGIWELRIDYAQAIAFITHGQAKNCCYY